MEREGSACRASQMDGALGDVPISHDEKVSSPDYLELSCKEDAHKINT